MARPLRLEFAGAFYHVTARGDRRENIYESDADRSVFLSILQDVCDTYNWVCLGYCLMNNHYHLLVETPEANLSKGMRQASGPIVQRWVRPTPRSAYELFSPDRNTAIDLAYKSGAYTQKEIGDYFGLHYSTVSGIVKIPKSKT